MPFAEQRKKFSLIVHVRMKRYVLRWIVWGKRLQENLGIARKRTRKLCLETRPPFRKARLSQGLSLDTVAYKLGIPRSTLEKIESDRYQNAGLSPAFLTQVVSQYGTFLGLSKRELGVYMRTLPSGRNFFLQILTWAGQFFMQRTRMSFVLSIFLCLSLYAYEEKWSPKIVRNGLSHQDIQMITIAIKKAEVCRMGQKCEPKSSKLKKSKQDQQKKA